jgi:hypothetical protein
MVHLYRRMEEQRFDFPSWRLTAACSSVERILDARELVVPRVHALRVESNQESRVIRLDAGVEE